MSHLPSLPGEGCACRMQPRYLSKAVCRSLFGTVDHEELRRDLKDQLKEMKSSHCLRWNFDFQNHSPLAGNYIWEAFDTRDVPSFYRDPSAPLPATDTRCSQEAPRESKPEGKSKKSRKKGAQGSRKREIPTPITDFFPKRKRTVDSKPLIPRMRTPRKRIR
ncbi:cyclin-dependent kinase inhibitor 1B-like [Scyliorhinus canicula]|uniref:cyclin-dependent kinase inhibitor 1B-like n=1 Tax=Scyliorhinus canicula TaxID=7830 RepID=UPI0018F42B26|nr:cyclin-dependent kinase inhibitor 1B-like [Scyliorhinus canicula]